MVYRDGRPGFIYLASHPDGLLKIGFTVSLKQRLEALSRGEDNPPYVSRKPVYPVSVLVDMNYQAEQEIHQRFASHRFGTKRSEWYQDCAEIRQYFTGPEMSMDELARKQREYRRKRRAEGLDK